MFNVSASLEHACLQSLTKVLDSPCNRFLRKVIPDHLQSCATILDCWWLTVVFIFLRDCKIVMLTTNVMATKLARSYSAWLSCWKPITSCISQAGRISHQQSRSVAQDWRWSFLGAPCTLCARATFSFDIFTPKLGHVTRTTCWRYVPILKFIDLCVLIYLIISCRFRGPFARQPVLPWQPFCAALVGGVILMLASKDEHDTTTHYWVIAIFNWIRCVTLWPWPLIFWPWCHVKGCHLGVQSLY